MKNVNHHLWIRCITLRCDSGTTYRTTKKLRRTQEKSCSAVKLQRRPLAELKTSAFGCDMIREVALTTCTGKFCAQDLKSDTKSSC